MRHRFERLWDAMIDATIVQGHRLEDMIQERAQKKAEIIRPSAHQKGTEADQKGTITRVPALANALGSLVRFEPGVTQCRDPML